MLYESRLSSLERAANDLLDRLPFAPELDLAALDAGHVEQIINQRVHPARLFGDRTSGVALQPCKFRLGQLERFRETDESGQRGSEVVRERGEQRIAQTLRFHVKQRLLRDLDVMDALESDRDQGRERIEMA